MNEKIVRQTNAQAYEDNLEDDANSLGLKLVKLKKILSRKCKITVKARKLFNLMMLKHSLPSCHWNKMPAYVKEKENALVGRKTTRVLIKLK